MMAGTTTNIVAIPISSSMLARISESGEVWIDWDKAEQTIAEPSPDQTMLVIAHLMLAIRDGEWKPLIGGLEN